MKVLWFTNIPLPAVDRHLGIQTIGSGHWMTQLLELLKEKTAIEIGVATIDLNLKKSAFESEGVKYYTGMQYGSESSPHELNLCQEFIEDFKPDVIHVHGTERFFGLIGSKKLTDVPVIISIQGILQSITPKLLGRLSRWQAFRLDRWRDFLRADGLFWFPEKIKKSVKEELEIFKGNNLFIGRTNFDKEYVERLNPEAKYFHVDELLRPTFHQARWDINNCDRHTIIYANTSHPYRNAETLLYAAKELIAEYPVRIFFPGALQKKFGYGLHLQNLVKKLELEEHVDFAGYLNSQVMAQGMAKSGVFVNASLCENSSNSLCEAMMVGMPCLASEVGGLPSLIRDGEDGILFPPMASSVLAEKLKLIFEDDTLAMTLGSAAHEIAKQRHNPDQILDQLITAYQYSTEGEVVIDEE